MIDETKTIKAKDIVENPDDVFSFMQSHIMVGDNSMSGQKYDNMVGAINILFDAGWEIAGVTSNASLNNMTVIFKNTNYKRKNR